MENRFGMIFGNDVALFVHEPYSQDMYLSIHFIESVAEAYVRVRAQISPKPASLCRARANILFTLGTPI